VSAEGVPLAGEAFARHCATPLDAAHTPAPDWRLTAADVDSLPHVTRCALLAPAAAAADTTAASQALGPPRTLFYNRVGKAGSETLRAWLKAHRTRGAFTFTDLGAHEHLTQAGEMEHVARLQQHARSGWAGSGGGEHARGAVVRPSAFAARAAEALRARSAAGFVAAPRALVVDHVFFLNFSRYGLPVRLPCCV
jgi:hypothetical protein